MQFHTQVRNGVGQVGRAFDRCEVDPILYHPPERRTGQNGLTDDALQPSRWLALGVQASDDAMHEQGSIVAAFDIVLARPHQSDRRVQLAGRLGGRHRFGNVIRGGIGVAAEATTSQGSMNRNLLRLEAGDFRGDGLIERLRLGSSPNLAGIVLQLYHADQRFHWGVGEIGK